LCHDELLLKIAGMTTATPPAAEELGDAYFQDPQAVFARLRPAAPAVPVIMPGGGRAWLVTRYDDVRAALADPRLAKDWVRHMTPQGQAPDPVHGHFSRNMLTVDPPDHTRLRRLVQQAFTPRRVAALRPRVQQIADGLLGAMADSGGDVTDLIPAFAFPLPVTVICELLGIPGDDQEEFRAWSAAMVDSLVPADGHRAASLGMYQYFTELIAAKRRHPGDDLVSALITARDAGDSLSESELLSMLFLLLIAGHETTVNLIASGTLALLRHPGELARLRSGSPPLPAAVEELLRYASPVNHATERFTLEPVTIGDVTIPAREWVILATASANHDPARFRDAGSLDLGRDTAGHLAFGHGIHYCLGAPLARLEGEVALGSLLARFPELALAVPESSLRWRASSLIHGLESLPVRLR
jgi:cytochrome P450